MSQFIQLGRIKYSLHQIDGLKSFIEIDVRPCNLEHKVVMTALFQTGQLPEGATVTSSLGFDQDRYRIDYRKCGYIPMSACLRFPINKYITMAAVVGDHHLFIRGWRQRFKQKQKEYAERKAIHMQWMQTPHPSLGGMTPDEVVAKGYGPYEVKGVGFIWVGIDTTTLSRGSLQIQTRPYSKDSNFNQSIRWFMQRGTSLNQALELNNQHMTSLNQQALMNSIQILLGALKGGAGKKPISLISKTIHIASNSNKAIKAVVKANKGAKLTNSQKSIDSKIQILNSVQPTKIPIMTSK